MQRHRLQIARWFGVHICCKLLKQQADERLNKRATPTPTIFRSPGGSGSLRISGYSGEYRSPAPPLIYPPVNEMLEWVEDCGWALHSASSATAGDSSTSSKHHEMYVFARPKVS